MGTRWPRVARALMAVAVLEIVVAVSWPRPADAQWQADLAEQILEEHECEVAFVSQVMESEQQGRRILVAKVHCLDKRTFDVRRSDDFDPFEFDECDSPETKSC